jgi:CelD/BcsL family acetyltransferase involved in cellulose biosynthesis
MPLRAEIITNGKAFEALAPQWWELWRRCPFATPFQTPAWLLPWWRHFAPGQLVAIAVWREDRLIGLAPFYLEDGKETRLLPVGIALSDYLDLLIEPGAEQETAALIFEAGLTLGWDRWEFEELRPEALAAAIACPETMANEAEEQSACPVIALAGGDDLTGCVPARRRRQLRRAHAAAARRGVATIEAVSSDTDGLLDHLFRLHGARWAERGEAGIVQDKLVRNFHREALAALSDAGLARCYQIRIGGSIAGAYYGMCDGNAPTPISAASIRPSALKVPVLS